jgi:hypothetical protein
MPFKSWAQRRKFQEMLKRGEITKATYDEWDGKTDLTRLPQKAPTKSTPTRAPKARFAKVIK